MNQGWTCPSCGRGVAPTEKTCDHGDPVSRINPFGQATFPPAMMMGGGVRDCGGMSGCADIRCMCHQRRMANLGAATERVIF